MPSIVGKPNFGELIDPTINMNAVYIGEEIDEKRAALLLTHPMPKGIVKDWDIMEKV